MGARYAANHGMAWEGLARLYRRRTEECYRPLVLPIPVFTQYTP